MAVFDVARISGVGARTVWSWFQMIEGVRSDDRMPYLAPRNRATADRQRSKGCDPEFFAVIKADYLGLENPRFTDCYRRAKRVAKAKGWVASYRRLSKDQAARDTELERLMKSRQRGEK